jgi:hypothetical protein
MLASSTKHKIGDGQRSQPERGTQKKRNPKGTAHRRRKRTEKQHRTVREDKLGFGNLPNKD